MSFPLWQFLNQPIGDSKRPLILNPRVFWHRHHVRYLERCWLTNYRSEGNFHS